MQIHARLLLPLLLAFATPAFAEDIAEPSSGHTFAATRSDGGKSYTLVGTGLRKKFFIKVYAMGLYGEQEGGRKAWTTGSDHSQSFFIRGGFDKWGILYFLRDVDIAKIREAFRESLAAELSAGGDRQAAAESFLALFDRDLKKGDELHIRTAADGQISVRIGGQMKNGPQSTRLASAIWNIWLGSNPPTADMRTTLINRIDALGK